MSLQPRYPPELARVLASLELANREVSAIADDVGDVAARAVRLAVDTDWQTESARWFRVDDDRWQRDLAVLRDSAEYVRDETARLRARALEAAWRTAV
jgi:hypothetical protein